MMSDVKNLKQAFMPIIWLNCIFCMGVFEIPINRPRYFLSALYVISITTGYSIMLYKAIDIFQEVYKLEFMVYKFSAAITILVAILCVILFWCNWKNINTIIKRNSIVDNTLEEMGINIDYQKISCSILYHVAVWAGVIILMYILSVIWTHNDNIGYCVALYSSICLCFPVTLNTVIDLTFILFIRILQTKFQQTNTLINNIMLCASESNAFNIYHLQDLSVEDISVIFVMAKRDKIIHHIQTLRYLHLEITRIGREVNSTYCLQLLLELAVHFAAVTSSIFCIYSGFTGQSRVMINNEKIIVMIMWGAIYLFKIVLINWLCTNVSTEARKTVEILQSFEGSVIDNDIKEEIHQFTQQVVLNSLNLTAAHFFSIDNSLTSKFIATVSTYVVILIQMNNIPHTTRTT